MRIKLIFGIFKTSYWLSSNIVFLLGFICINVYVCFINLILGYVTASAYRLTCNIVIIANGSKCSKIGEVSIKCTILLSSLFNNCRLIIIGWWVIIIILRSSNSSNRIECSECVITRGCSTKLNIGEFVIGVQGRIISIFIYI